MRKAYQDYSIRALRPAQFTSLVRLNAPNGLARNGMKMGFPVEGLCRDEYICLTISSAASPLDRLLSLFTCAG